MVVCAWERFWKHGPFRRRIVNIQLLEPAFVNWSGHNKNKKKASFAFATSQHLTTKSPPECQQRQAHLPRLILGDRLASHARADSPTYRSMGPFAAPPEDPLAPSLAVLPCSAPCTHARTTGADRGCGQRLKTKRVYGWGACRTEAKEPAQRV